MNASELDLLATRDLIDELRGRTPSRGVIVYVADGAKTRHWEGERFFTVCHNANLDTEEAGRLLDVISQRIAS